MKNDNVSVDKIVFLWYSGDMKMRLWRAFNKAAKVLK